ncbi:molecular chaperone DnaJ [Candidatus Wolfebacteria bacterium]|nr:MAG: molecular chaperone DnaJ [Candidatus Wolfebacteria bacterium]
MSKDYYKILGVSKDATTNDIKSAFKKLAIKYHPDKGGDEEKFKEINTAKEILSNKEKREQYDRFGSDGPRMGNHGGQSPFDDMFSQFGDFFGSGFKREPRHRQRSNIGSNIRIRVKLNLLEILEGVTKKIKIKKHVGCKSCNDTGGMNTQNCQHCSGTGEVITVKHTVLGAMQTTSTCFSCNGEGKIIIDKCSSCMGEGIVKEDVELSVQIPKGVYEGVQLTTKGIGNKGRRGGENGNLLVIVEEIPHNQLKRDGMTLSYNLELDYMDVCLGTSVEVPTIKNYVRINIDPGTQHGKILKLKGKGLPDLNGHYCGDQLINIKVRIPTTLSDKERELLNKLKELK